ncbi:MAG: acyl carrier protein [Tissierellia bacterium]|nr:acyl carrier protein [Tissierellia bacterium]
MNEQRIHEIFMEKFGLETVSNDMVIAEDLGADSIALLEIVMDVEEEFDVEIDDETLSNIKTIGDVVNYFKG